MGPTTRGKDTSMKVRECVFLAIFVGVAFASVEPLYSKVVHVTCPDGCSTCQCSGCKNLTFPLGKCVSAGTTSQLSPRPIGANGYYVKPTCKSNGKTFIETIFLNKKCAGDPFSKTTINTDACVRTAGGQACAYFCE